MNRPSWDELYMNMCYEVASRSPDNSTHSGAYIAKKDYTPVSFGYNGMPRNILMTPERQERPQKYLFFEHSERNAIYNAGRNGVPLIDCQLYVNWLPCSDCARGIIQSGISKVIVHKQGMDAFLMSRNDTKWTPQHDIVFELFDETGVEFVWYTGPIRTGLTGMWSGKRYTFLGEFHEPYELSLDSDLVWKEKID